MNDLKFRPTAKDLLKIGKFCEAFHEITVLLQDSNLVSFPLIEQSNSLDFTSILNLSQTIRRVIDSNRCNDSDIYTIREHVSADLDSLRKKYSNLPDFLVIFI